MKVTIKEVAKQTGFSITTVSRALNGYSDVSEATREKIISVVKELNYQPNRVAQQLVTKRSNVIGMYSLHRATFQHPFINQIISGMMDQATEMDYNLLLFGSQAIKGSNVVRQECEQRGVGGVVILGLKTDDPIIPCLAQEDLPIVLVDIPISGRRATYVSSDNKLGIWQGIKHLADLGHKHIGFINGHSQAWVSSQRLAGYQEALRCLGLSWSDEYIITGDFSKESGREAALQLVTKNPELTAIFAASDLMASGALEGLWQSGYSIPRDLSLIGFDGQDIGLHTRPALTTIEQDMYGFGKLASKALIEMIQDPEYCPTHKSLRTRLVLRESTASPSQ